MTKKQVTTITLLSIIAIVLGVLVSGRIWFRLDLSKNHAYTISDVSKNLYKEIPDQVRVTYYLSEKLSAIHPMPGEVTDLLREYAAYAHGKIRITVKDPVKAQLEDTVEQLGIVPQQIQTVEKDQASIATVYTGITIEYLDAVEVLPFVFSLDTLEYDLTSRIRDMVRGTVREIGIIAGDSAKQWEQDFGTLDQFLQLAGFRVRQISAGDEVPDDLGALFVFGGVEELNEWALYRIDRYIQTGGRVLFAFDGVFVNSQGNLDARSLVDQGLLSMVASYGAIVKSELVLDRSALTIQYQTASRSGMQQVHLARYPLWIGILTKNGNAKHPLTSQFSGIDLFWASPIELSPSGSVTAEPLFTTTDEAWLETKDFYASPEIPYMLEAELAGTKGKKTMAAVLTGTFNSYFAGRAKPEREGATETLPDMPAFAKEARIIVIGDGDVASAFVQRRENFDFMAQTALYLSNDDDIITIRNRQPQAGRLDRITDEAKRGMVMNTARIVNLGLIPLLVVAVGLFLRWRRTKFK
ncbi:MAG: GldG family protein [Treponema sp.]|jgi:gliding-associated putative ABC transporter substrate-binding component GldG|nr:GldG family protein [Treponema sp.]